jgi:hypothetical protein
VVADARAGEEEEEEEEVVVVVVRERVGCR